MKLGPYRIQVKQDGRWIRHCTTRSLDMAEAVARHLRQDGKEVRIVRTVTHR